MYSFTLAKILFLTVLAFFLGSISLVNAIESSDSTVGEFKVKTQKGFDRAMKRHRIIVEKGGVFPRKSNRYVRYGRNSFLVETPGLRRGVKGVEYIKNRSEIEIVRPVGLEAEHWLQFSVFFPKNFKRPDSWFVFFQAWQKNAGNPILALSLDAQGRMQIGVRNDEYHKGGSLILYREQKEIIKGVWHDFVIRLEITEKLNNGSLSVWRRTGGEQRCFKALVNESGLTIGKSAYRNGRSIKKIDRFISFRTGIYRGGSNLTHRVWFDGLKYGKRSVVKELYININCID